VFVGLVRDEGNEELMGVERMGAVGVLVVTESGCDGVDQVEPVTIGRRVECVPTVLTAVRGIRAVVNGEDEVRPGVLAKVELLKVGVVAKGDVVMVFVVIIGEDWNGRFIGVVLIDTADVIVSKESCRDGLVIVGLANVEVWVIGVVPKVLVVVNGLADPLELRRFV